MHSNPLIEHGTWKRENGTGKRKIQVLAMSKIESFEDLLVWQESMRLIKSIKGIFNFDKYNPLLNQLFRSSISIPSNISEGFERQTNREYIQFLFIAKGSCGELRTQLYIAREMDLISQNQLTELTGQAKKISSMLYKLIQVRKQKFS